MTTTIYQNETTTIYQNETTALPAFLAAIHCRKTSSKNRSQFTGAQIEVSTNIFLLAVAAYPSSQVYRNYRKDYISIKVDHPRMVDSILKEVDLLNECCENHSVDRVRTINSVIYRIN